MRYVECTPKHVDQSAHDCGKGISKNGVMLEVAIWKDDRLRNCEIKLLYCDTVDVE